ncbi:hypothetical protein AAH991_36470 [Microbispora sp. ZYX-F-249]|uniref:Uncharacterized protein n=1 Tax=Microbispora maris TaxID=3144104 RepID=A0ABV0B0S3_9ACTN
MWLAVAIGVPGRLRRLAGSGAAQVLGDRALRLLDQLGHLDGIERRRRTGQVGGGGLLDPLGGLGPVADPVTGLCP